MQAVRFSLLASMLTLALLTSCANPRFSVPYTKEGYPDARDINKRIRCELAQMVSDSGHFPLRKLLLQGNYRVAAVLTLGGKQSGGLKPSLGFPRTVTSGTFDVDVIPNVSKTVERTSVTYLSYDLQLIYERTKDADANFSCPLASSSLAGSLEINELVAMSAPLPVDQEAGPPGGQFGGTITFTTVTGITGGPTWTLKRFVGPGSLLSASNEFTDKLTLAFYQRPQGLNSTEAEQAYATRILQSIVDQDTSRQLSSLISNQ